MKYDVLIVGASISGCTAATLYARQGLKVALLEREVGDNHYKVLCSHFLQNSCLPVINKLGLMDEILSQGGMRHGMELWTRWGWVRPRTKLEGAPDVPVEDLHEGLTFRREKLDPMLRDLANSTEGVDFYPGHAVTELIEEKGKVTGVKIRKKKDAPNIGTENKEFELSAELVVVAAGRGVKIKNTPKEVEPDLKSNGRFCYLAFFKNVPLISENDSQIYFLDPDVASVFPKDDGLTLLVVVLHNNKEQEFKKDLENNFVKYFKQLPGGPDMSKAERTSKIIGYRNLHCFRRRTSYPGLAYIGDSAHGGDPLWGIGCGWAFQSADWLVSSTADALVSNTGLNAALENYRKLHRKKLYGYLYLMEDYASGRKYNWMEKLFYSAAARDPSGEMARSLHDFASRNIRVFQYLTLGNVFRSLWVNLRFLFRTQNRMTN